MDTSRYIVGMIQVDNLEVKSSSLIRFGGTMVEMRIPLDAYLHQFAGDAIDHANSTRGSKAM